MWSRYEIEDELPQCDENLVLTMHTRWLVLINDETEVIDKKLYI